MTQINSEHLVNIWHNSKRPEAVRVRKDIIKGVYWCRNAGFSTDMDYLTSVSVLENSIRRCGYKMLDALTWEDKQ